MALSPTNAFLSSSASPASPASPICSTSSQSNVLIFLAFLGFLAFLSLLAFMVFSLTITNFAHLDKVALTRERAAAAAAATLVGRPDHTMRDSSPACNSKENRGLREEQKRWYEERIAALQKRLQDAQRSNVVVLPEGNKEAEGEGQTTVDQGIYRTLNTAGGGGRTTTSDGSRKDKGDTTHLKEKDTVSAFDKLEGLQCEDSSSATIPVSPGAVEANAEGGDLSPLAQPIEAAGGGEPPSAAKPQLSPSLAAPAARTATPPRDSALADMRTQQSMNTAQTESPASSIHRHPSEASIFDL